MFAKNIGCPDSSISLVHYIDAVTKQLSVRYLNVVNARPSHAKRISLRLHALLVDFASALLKFAQVAYSKMPKYPPFHISYFT